LPKVDLVMVWLMSYLGTSVGSLLYALAELYRHGLVVIHGHADDGTTVETGGLLVAADLLVDTRRRHSARRPCAGQIRDEGLLGLASDDRR
jgi:hypothetical protein